MFIVKLSSMSFCWSGNASWCSFSGQMVEWWCFCFAISWEAHIHLCNTILVDRWSAESKSEENSLDNLGCECGVGSVTSSQARSAVVCATVCYHEFGAATATSAKCKCSLRTQLVQHHTWLMRTFRFFWKKYVRQCKHSILTPNELK